MPGYSKAPRGLFVLLRVGSIFTATSISPGLSLRQYSSCYTVRAGRNLPDKEFRYLRTVYSVTRIACGHFWALRIATKIGLYHFKQGFAALTTSLLNSAYSL